MLCHLIHFQVPTRPERLPTRTKLPIELPIELPPHPDLNQQINYDPLPQIKTKAGQASQSAFMRRRPTLTVGGGLAPAYY